MLTATQWAVVNGKKIVDICEKCIKICTSALTHVKSVRVYVRRVY